MTPFLTATNALGTRAELLIDAPESSSLRAVAEAAIGEIHYWHDRLSRFQPDSFLSHINRTAAFHPVALDEDLFALLSLCDRVVRDSSGAFDPTLASAWESCVELDCAARTVRFTRPGIDLDLGGVAKGFALDRAADVLREHRVESALLHAGTSGVIAIGPVARRIGVRTAVGVDLVTLTNESLCVSAQRGRDHIVGPTGESAHRDATSLVVGPSCAECDAWATALIVNGESLCSPPDHLRHAVHDGAAWSTRRIHFVAPSEAA
jgi:thiamine biosynthesis lipoprotein